LASIPQTPSSLPSSDGAGLNTAALARASRKRRWLMAMLAAPALLLVGVLLVLPVGWLFGLSFVKGDAASLAHYERMFEYGSYARIFRTTFELSAIVTLICVLLGYPVAYLLAQLPARVASVALALVIIPFWTSVLVRTYAWLVLLQQQGLINQALLKIGFIDAPVSLVYSYTGTAIGMVHIMLPFMILPLYSAIKAFDWDLMLAASSLGASPASAFFRVFVPLSAPGLVAGALLVFIVSLGFYVTPQMLGGGNVIMVSMKIASNVSTYFDWGAASALGVVLLSLVALCLYVAQRFVAIDRATPAQ
jgi:ABC-type spermidine/putrescine transport system permease subunit I